MHVKRGLLIALMAVGSVSMWVLNPVLWFWLTSHLQARASQAQMGPYVLLLVGVVGTAIVLAKALAALNRSYGRLSGADPTVRIIVPWRRSLRDVRHGGGEDPGRLPVSVLDVVMVLSVVAAIVAFAVWFLIVNPTPPGVGPGSSKD
jgi:MFS family permease